MALLAVRDLLKAGVHYGHRTSRWNPRMEPYLFGKRNSIHIVDLSETVKGLYKAYKYLVQISRDGKETVFVGTKRPAQRPIREGASRCGMHFVRTRWIGGTLTNFDVVRSRLERLEELESLEESGAIGNYSKKMIASLMREKRKIARNLEGIKFMERMPGAMVVVDPAHEIIAIREARKREVPVIALTDTNCDPDVVDIVIPGNDDAIKSIALIVSKLTDAVLEGRDGEPGPTALEEQPDEPAGKAGSDSSSDQPGDAEESNTSAGADEESQDKKQDKGTKKKRRRK